MALIKNIALYTIRIKQREYFLIDKCQPEPHFEINHNKCTHARPWTTTRHTTKQAATKSDSLYTVQ